MDVWTPAWIISLLLLLRIIYRCLTKPYEYWSDRGVPSVPAYPICGNLIQNFSKPFREVIHERYRKYGRIFGYYEGNRPVLSLADPDLLKDILVKDFHIFTNRRDLGYGDGIVAKMVTAVNGEEWKRIRTIITPAFSSGRIKKMAAIMKQSAEITAKNFEKYAETGKPADMKKILGAFTLDVIARSSFGTTLDSHNDPENEFVRVVSKAFTRGISLKLVIFFLFPRLLEIFRTSVFTSQASKYFENVVVNIIKHRRKTGQVQNDFLQLLIEANDEVTNNNGKSRIEEEENQDDADKRIKDLGHDEMNRHVFKPVKKYRGLTYDEVVAQCINFFLAGYDTTASTLSFASYLLALNPECQEKAMEEIDGVLRQNKGDLTYEGVLSMKYLENIIWETLRLYPPALSIERIASEDYKLGNTGIIIPKGMLVHVPVHSIHYDPEYYQEPEKFNPDRFLPEAKAARNPYTYLPFGAGPRNCIGMRFALMEIKFCLAVLLSRFRFTRSSETKVPLEFLKSPSLLQAIGIVLTVQNRKEKVESS